MKSIDTRRALGLILMGVGLLFAAIYLVGQLNISTGSMPPLQLYYGQLVPTLTGKALPTASANRSSTASSATPAATSERINTPDALTSPAGLAPAATTA